MRRLVGTSWKMNVTSTEAARYFDVLVPLIADIDDRELFVLPPFTAIWVARARLSGTRVGWGAQHVHPDDLGAHTGDVSAPMLADLGCRYVEVGHSERRRDYGEDDRLVAAQVASIQRWGMTAIVCVGERAVGSLDAALAELRPQVRCLEGVDADRLVVAYEPAWAIGRGATAASASWIAGIHRAVHDELAAVGLASIPVIYGGSVDVATATGILAESGVDGLFVGRSALDPVVFAQIAHSPFSWPLPGLGV